MFIRGIDCHLPSKSDRSLGRSRRGSSVLQPPADGELGGEGARAAKVGNPWVPQQPVKGCPLARVLLQTRDQLDPAAASSSRAAVPRVDKVPTGGGKVLLRELGTGILDEGHQLGKGAVKLFIRVEGLAGGRLKERHAQTPYVCLGRVLDGLLDRDALGLGRPMDACATSASGTASFHVPGA